MRRRVAAIVAVFLLVTGTVAVVWSGLNLLPPLWIVKYGFHPGCEPTGEVTVEGVEFVVIGRGCFRMGSTENGKPGTLVGRLCGPVAMEWGESPVPSDEMPVHWVQFPEGFALAKTEITNAQYEAYDPDHDRGWTSPSDRDPAVGVSWEDAKAYCAWLEKRSGRPVRLPTEAEWEAACRAGSETEFCFGDDDARLDEYAWYGEDGKAPTHSHPVGTKKPNAWGLYDLHGNVWEWCEDRWHDSYRSTDTGPGPDGRPRMREASRAPTDGTPWLFDSGSPNRVFRGGGWVGDSMRCRSASRAWRHRSSGNGGLGLRPALTVPADP